MRALIAFDKFKDALTADAACAAAAAALTALHPDWTLDRCALTDGGEGFAAILTRSAGGEFHPVRVTGPRGSPVVAALGCVPWRSIPPDARAQLQLASAPRDADEIAIIEMAVASGLALLPGEQRDPWRTTSRGTGELIRFAAARGVAAIVLGIGGSATNDLGVGALEALGLRLQSRDGADLGATVPAMWHDAARIEARLAPGLPPVRIACDVKNPLLGRDGCTAIFGPQKGLRAEDSPQMEAAIARMAARLLEAAHAPDELLTMPGAGAAGGIGFGLCAALGARILPGYDLVASWLDLEARLQAADLVITGEGRFDATSLRGKGCGAIALRAAALGKRVHVFAGRVATEAPVGMTLHAISPPAMTLAEALPQTSLFLTRAVRTQLA